MKLFALFTVLSFISGLVIWRQPNRQRLWLVICICAAVSFIYFFMNQI